MARRLRDATLDSREARSRLKARGKPYWRKADQGVDIGFRKPQGRKGKPAGAGAWVARYYVGKGKYKTEKIGVADDISDPDGVWFSTFGRLSTWPAALGSAGP